MSNLNTDFGAMGESLGWNRHGYRGADGMLYKISAIASIEKIVPVLASDYKPLLGVAMMEGYHLEIDFADNGLVSLEKITD